MDWAQPVRAAHTTDSSSPLYSKGRLSPRTGRLSCADMHCWVHGLLTQPSQLPVSQPSTAPAPRGSEHPMAPRSLPKPWQDTPTAGGHRAKAMTAPPHQTARGHTPGHAILLHTAALLQGQRDPDPAPRVTQCHTGAVPPPRDPEHTHPPTFQHFPALSGAVGQLLVGWVGSQRAPVPPRPLCKLPADPTKSCSSSLPGRAGCPGSRARELDSDG